MQSKLIRLLLLALLLPLQGAAQTFVNLTPRPKTMTVASGSVALPTDFKISSVRLDDEMKAEINRFAADFNAATGYTVSAVENDAEALMKVTLATRNDLREDGYTISSTDGVSIQITAKTALGLYYAFQSVKKILPANVMAGVRDEAITTYSFPKLFILDEPRYDYRGFMLDVSRHFFTVEEVKRMIDVMAYYKMNRFHWHLSDDQGWRVEIKKYPRLTTVGSIAPNSRFTDMYTCSQYWINKPYGPYFYTQEEIKDVVAYAKKQHIEIVPEIDMPGHFVAAMAAYPEYSCSPNATHTIWSDGGISSDVMNVANPEAVQFAKDILAELIEIFPYEVIHIGGDECPTTAWEGNALCQAKYAELGLTNYRQLQSHFIKEMADFVQSKGRKLAVWNEAITAGNADTETVKSTDALVYCWTGPEAAAAKAQQLGLKNIYTPWGPYYINRKQGNSAQDPPGAGDGTDNVKKTYNQTVPAATDYGVQATFWCEHVSDRDYMEWLALPRLLAVAEAGWTPAERKNWADFQLRMTADTVLLNYKDYKYCKYFMTEEETMVMPHVNTAEDKYYYRIVSGCTDGRSGRCWELLSATSPLLTTYSANGALEGRVWTNAQAAESDENYDYQWWSLEEDPANPGKYALVCKAVPEGSVNPSPTANGTGGRWSYDNTGKHYNFILGSNGYGTVNENYYYSITSDALTNLYANSSQNGQGYAVNVYGNPADGRGGLWEFSPKENYDPVAPPVEFVKMEVGKTYLITNNVEGYEATALADDGTQRYLQHSTDPFANNAWTVTEAADNEDGTQNVKLKNVATNRFIGTALTYTSRIGRRVQMNASTAAALTLTYNPAEECYRFKQSGTYSLSPTTDGTIVAGSNVTADDYDAPRLQGAEWNFREARVVTLVCMDNENHELGTFTRTVPADVTEITEELCPTFKNMSFFSSEEMGEENQYLIVYTRSSYNVMLRCVDEKGAILAEIDNAVPVGERFTMYTPEIPHYTKESAEMADGVSYTPSSDFEFYVYYATNAYTGIKKLGRLVTKLNDERSYALYDASTADNGSRAGFRRIVPGTYNINRLTSAENADPGAVWMLEKSGDKYKVKNEYYGLYVPALARSAATTASATGDAFNFSLNSDGESFKVTGTNGMFWDGVANGDLVGWNSGNGHPIKVYEIWASPFFKLQIRCIDQDGNVLRTSEKLFPAGEAYSLITPVIEDYDILDISGAENLDGFINDNYEVVITYINESSGIGEVTTTPDESKKSGIYDLMGRRLSRITTPGLYIVNGKKVLKK